MSDVLALVDDVTPVTRERILALQELIGQAEQVECPVRHFFANGLYAREMFIPAGVCLVGKIHRHEQIYMVLGDVTIATPGAEPERVNACEPRVAGAGVKRAIYAHADTFFTTFHTNPTNERDLDVIESALIAPSFAMLDAEITEKLEAA